MDKGVAAALNARVYGNAAETVVLAHGFGSDQSVWHYILPYLMSVFRVVVFDLAFSGTVRPGVYDRCKYSTYEGYASDLADLLRELNISNSIYVGHSMSAMIGCIAAVKHPRLFKHLVLLNGSPKYLNTPNYVGGFTEPSLKAIFHAMEEDYTGWAAGFAPKAVGVNDTAAVAEFRGSLLRMRPAIALHAAKTVFDSDWRQILMQVKLPCSIIQPYFDIIVPKSVPDYMASNLGGESRVEILKVEGHFPQLTAHSVLLEALKRALAPAP